MKPIGGIQPNNKRGSLRASLLIAAIYGLIGYVWIIWSELIVASTHHESADVFLISIWKGLAFVTASAVLIYILVYSNLRKVYRESLIRQESESALQEAQHLAHVGNFSFDAKTQTYRFSNEALQILDLSEEDLPYSFEKLLRKVHINDRDMVQTLSTEATMNGRETVFDCRVLRMHAPERTIQIHLQSILGDHPDQLYIIGTLQDVTERVQAENAA